MYVFRDTTPASGADLDLIAAARTSLPLLLDEITAPRPAQEGTEGRQEKSAE
jgi:hypothetical protein